ncbi:unnamed protein product, partial [Tenebrio molitor]
HVCGLSRSVGSQVIVARVTCFLFWCSTVHCYSCESEAIEVNKRLSTDRGVCFLRGELSFKMWYFNTNKQTRYHLRKSLEKT